MDVDDEWEQFMNNDYTEINTHDKPPGNSEDSSIGENNNPPYQECPASSPIYISTKSKIAYLNQNIELQRVFWDLPVIMYTTPDNGIVKKQMKFNSSKQEEVDCISNNLENETYVVEQILQNVKSPSGSKDWFKDVRKISIGISQKDILSYRSKQKCAFYNCFVMILRVLLDEHNTGDGVFHEFHVKIFNTGKVEIPGIRSDYQLNLVLSEILVYLRPIVGESLDYKGPCDTVLINSNFNCGFFINRELLFTQLRNKYNIQSIYDPCSYPGIQCKFYYDKNKTEQTGILEDESQKKNENTVVISFMIFRTGSILIVGMCDELVLEEVYEFIKAMLKKEFNLVYQKICSESDMKPKVKKTKVRKKTIIREYNPLDRSVGSSLLTNNVIATL
tara:strand:+ start:14091 stop:15260 length:1170 start_codon:yes stop_codon:yes gene_type:complete